MPQSTMTLTQEQLEAIASEVEETIIDLLKGESK